LKQNSEQNYVYKLFLVSSCFHVKQVPFIIYNFFYFAVYYTDQRHLAIKVGFFNPYHVLGRFCCTKRHTVGTGDVEVLMYNY
jgi:hypothetical protein